MSTRGVIVSVITMSDEHYAARLAAAKKREQDAYHRYYGAGVLIISRLPGHPHTAGHGSWTTNLSPNGEQEAWYAARDHVKQIERYRSGDWRHDGHGVFGIVSHADCVLHEITIDTHGVDVSHCRTPREAIVEVQRYFSPI